MGRLMGIEPTNAGTTIRCVNHFATIAVLKWWLGTESNRRHKDFQSFALPTELPSLIKFKMAVPTGIEPAISCVTGRHVNRYTTGPLGCGDRI
jgi:hypothetical protein